MGEPNTAFRRLRDALSGVLGAGRAEPPARGGSGPSGAAVEHEKEAVAPIPDAVATWRGLDHAPTPDEWYAIEEAIRATERARLAAAVHARVGFRDPYYNAALWDAIAIING